MNNQFTQPDKLVAVQTNKQAIARSLGVKQSAVTYLSTASAVDGYTVLYDKASQTCWDNSTVAATGTPTSWSASGTVLTLITSVGTFSLNLIQPVSSVTYAALLARVSALESKSS